MDLFMTQSQSKMQDEAMTCPLPILRDHTIYKMQRYKRNELLNQSRQSNLTQAEPPKSSAVVKILETIETLKGLMLDDNLNVSQKKRNREKKRLITEIKESLEQGMEVCRNLSPLNQSSLVEGLSVLINIKVQPMDIAYEALSCLTSLSFYTSVQNNQIICCILDFINNALNLVNQSNSNILLEKALLALGNSIIDSKDAVDFFVKNESLLRLFITHLLYRNDPILIKNCLWVLNIILKKESNEVIYLKMQAENIYKPISQILARWSNSPQITLEALWILVNMSLSAHPDICVLREPKMLELVLLFGRRSEPQLCLPAITVLSNTLPQLSEEQIQELFSTEDFRKILETSLETNYKPLKRELILLISNLCAKSAYAVLLFLRNQTFMFFIHNLTDSFDNYYLLDISYFYLNILQASGGAFRGELLALLPGLPDLYSKIMASANKGLSIETFEVISRLASTFT